MSIKKIIILIILFYFLALLQTSFLVHFRVLGFIPNLIFILVIFWNFFEKSEDFLGVFNALIGGFFLDVFSDRIIGFNILILLALALFIKLVLKKHVRLPVIKKI
jgi:rod shape-determining protein MreD